jgi:iron complex outermembrane receptor protein
MAAPVASAADNEQKEPVGLEQITVKEKAMAEPVTSPYAIPESASISTIVFTKEDILAINPQTIYDVLNYVPGMYVTSQGRRSLNHLSSRGGGMDTVGIMLDGVYMPIGTATRVLATLPMEDVESIMVVRDSSMLTLGPLMGFNAHGSFPTSLGASDQGFIVIRTKRASASETGASGGIASYGTAKEHAYTGDKINDFDYRLSYTHQQTDGRSNWYEASRYDSLLFRGGYTGKAISVDVFADLGTSMRDMQRGLLSTGAFANTQKWSYDPLHSSLLGVNVTKPWDERQTTTFTYSYSRVDDDMMTGVFGGATPTTSFAERDYLQGFDLRHIITFENNTLKVGGQTYEWSTPTGEFSYDGKRRAEDLYGFYLYDEHRLFDNRLTVDGAVRVDKKFIGNGIETDGMITENASTKGGVTTVTTTSNPTVNTWTKPVESIAFGAAYKFNSIYKLTARVSYSQQQSDSFLFTAGDLNYILRGRTGAAPSNLPSENRFRYEAGVSAAYHPAFTPYVTFFAYDTGNSKIAETLPTNIKVVDSTGNTVNVMKAQTVISRGVDIGLSGFLKQIPLNYYLTYSYIGTDNALTNEGIAHQTWSARLHYQHRTGFEANVSAKYVGSYRQAVTENINNMLNVSSLYGMGDYTRVDANVAYNFKALGKDMRIMIYGQNLANEHYVTMYNGGAYPDLGIVFGTELRVKF